MNQKIQNIIPDAFVVDSSRRWESLLKGKIEEDLAFARDLSPAYNQKS
jgi:hypothetical protein